MTHFPGKVCLHLVHPCLVVGRQAWEAPLSAGVHFSLFLLRVYSNPSLGLRKTRNGAWLNTFSQHQRPWSVCLSGYTLSSYFTPHWSLRVLCFPFVSPGMHSECIFQENKFEKADWTCIVMFLSTWNICAHVEHLCKCVICGLCLLLSVLFCRILAYLVCCDGRPHTTF